MADFDEMRRYSHGELYPHIYNRVGFERTAQDTILEAVQDGVRILEMSLDVNFIQFYNSGATGFIRFIQEFLDRSGASLDFRPEIGMSKNRDPAHHIRLALECVDSKRTRAGTGNLL